MISLTKYYQDRMDAEHIAKEIRAFLDSGEEHVTIATASETVEKKILDKLSRSFEEIIVNGSKYDRISYGHKSIDTPGNHLWEHSIGLEDCEELFQYIDFSFAFRDQLKKKEPMLFEIDRIYGKHLTNAYLFGFDDGSSEYRKIRKAFLDLVHETHSCAEKDQYSFAQYQFIEFIKER